MKLIGAGAFIIRIMYFTHHQHRKSKHANHGKPVPDLYTGKDIAGNNYTDRRARQSFKISMDRSHFHIKARQSGCAWLPEPVQSLAARRSAPSRRRLPPFAAGTRAGVKEHPATSKQEQIQASENASCAHSTRTYRYGIRSEYIRLARTAPAPVMNRHPVSQRAAQAALASAAGEHPRMDSCIKSTRIRMERVSPQQPGNAIASQPHSYN